MRRPFSRQTQPARSARRNEAAVPWNQTKVPQGPVEDVDPWATDAWRMWHQKEPREIIPTSFKFPKKMVPVGKANRILYRSDKWEEDGDFYTYYHDFDSHPTVYTTEKSPLAKGLRSNGEEKIDVADFLGMEHINAELSLPLLATTMELIITGEDGKKRTKKFRLEPPLCCTSDLKTLVILSDDIPIIIRGGKMVVTERGIVR